MNRVMTSRAAVLFALVLLLVGSLTMGVRSYWQFDAASLGGFGVLSELGEVYVFRVKGGFRMKGDESHYWDGRAGDFGRLEEEMGLTYQPWLPARTWRYGGDRFVSVQWWSVAMVLAGLLWWRWRRWRSEKSDAPGFAVVTRGVS